jgi:hypothetical protein
VDEASEAAFAKGRIVTWEVNDRFRFTFGAIHGIDHTTALAMKANDKV